MKTDDRLMELLIQRGEADATPTEYEHIFRLNILTVIREAEAAAADKARREERKANCKAICDGCWSNKQYDASTGCHIWCLDGGDENVHCKAAAIRARGNDDE